jgi:hypothetical protein
MALHGSVASAPPPGVALAGTLAGARQQLHPTESREQGRGRACSFYNNPL